MFTHAQNQHETLISFSATHPLLGEDGMEAMPSIQSISHG